MDDLINQTADAIEQASMLNANGDGTVDIIRVRRLLRDFRAEALKLAAEKLRVLECVNGNETEIRREDAMAVIMADQ